MKVLTVNAHYPGVAHVEHVFFYEVAVGDRAKLHEYLQRAYELGRDFAVLPAAEPAARA